MPHGFVHRLDPEGTEAVLAGERWEGQPLARAPYFGRFGGGVVVLPRQTALDVPMDPRFIGWGQEDEAWAIALTQMVGPCARGNATLVHLWHPPQKRATEKKGSAEGRALWWRYSRARGKPDTMRRLIGEALNAYDDRPKAALHDPASCS